MLASHAKRRVMACPSPYVGRVYAIANPSSLSFRTPRKNGTLNAHSFQAENVQEGSPVVAAWSEPRPVSLYEKHDASDSAFTVRRPHKWTSITVKWTAGRLDSLVRRHSGHSAGVG